MFSCGVLRVPVRWTTLTGALDYVFPCKVLRVRVHMATRSGAYGYAFGCVLSPEALSRTANHHVSGTRRTMDYLLRVSCAPSRLLCSGGGRAIALAEGWHPDRVLSPHPAGPTRRSRSIRAGKVRSTPPKDRRTRQGNDDTARCGSSATQEAGHVHVTEE